MGLADRPRLEHRGAAHRRHRPHRRYMPDRAAAGTGFGTAPTAASRGTDGAGIVAGALASTTARSNVIGPRIQSAARSAIMIVGALVLPPISVGITEASTTRRFSMPC